MVFTPFGPSLSPLANRLEIIASQPEIFPARRDFGQIP